jgi:bone morphogenetic protein receptor type-2
MSNYEFCYAAWKVGKNGNPIISSQGCWEHANDCNQSECLGSLTSQNVFFCCCNGDMCNNNLTTITPQTSPIVVPPRRSQGNDNSVLKNPAVWVSFVLTGVMLVIIAAVFLMSCRTKTKAQPEESPLAPSGPGYSSNLYNVDNLKPISIIGEGK